MFTVDTKGYSCPEPVLMTKRAVEGGNKELQVFVDTHVAQENVTRYLESEGFQVTVSENHHGAEITAKK